jgi:hypothetical protein
MVIARLRGGLGNQMFQYATAKSLARRLGCEFRVHAPRTFTRGDRPYELDCFGGEIPRARLREFHQFRGGVLAWPLLRKRRHPQVRQESGHNFEPSLFAVKSPVYLEGYWQSDKYFQDDRDAILRDFTFVNPLPERLRTIAADISGTSSVALHVRRGDYVGNSHHDTVGLAYYRAAIEHITASVPNARFFAFSDDLAWVRANLAPNISCILVEDTRSGPEDLRLMSSCNHQIIANSSFSWWGAWLNRNPNKIVVAPARWLNKPAHLFEDIYPEGCVRI